MAAGTLPNRAGPQMRSGAAGLHQRRRIRVADSAAARHNRISRGLPEALREHRKNMFEKQDIKPGAGPGATRANGMARDLRIDFFRGLALWMIFIDHIDNDRFGLLTYRNFGFSDAKEIFISLSGISCCLLYGKLEVQRGLARTQLRALYRSAQIYLGYVFVTFFTFVALLALRHLAQRYLAADPEFTLLFDDPGRALITSAYLYYTPEYLDILPLYLWLVAAAPLLLRALRHAPRLTLSASALLWLAAGTGYVPQLPRLGPDGAAMINPFSWQFLFCLGLWTGRHFYLGGRGFRASRPLRLLCIAVIAANLLSILVAHTVEWPVGQHEPLVVAMHDLRQAIRLSPNEHPLSLLHFLSIAYLTASLVRADNPLLRTAWAKPLVLTGQFSLQTFCLGAVMSVLGTLYWDIYAPSLPAQLLASLAGCALMALLATVLAVVRRETTAHRYGAPTRSSLDGPAALPQHLG